jgi:hypothetical protein
LPILLGSFSLFLLSNASIFYSDSVFEKTGKFKQGIKDR